jgi:serine/threonine protein phosphatase 1
MSASVAFGFASRLWRKRPAPTVNAGGRVIYAIGDVHGRADLLSPLVRTIADDAAAMHLDEKPVLILLGDYVDRGNASRDVIDQVIALQADPRFDCRALKGNHEEALLSFLEDANFGPTWGDFGGLQTLRSYGVTPPTLRGNSDEWEKARLDFQAALPSSHLTLLRRLEAMVEYGDYAFVHAGVRPGVPLEEQSEHDLLWIRDEFLQHPSAFERVIVHGHTPEEEPFLGAHRIGVDTGAYATGVLTAVKLHDEARSIIQASAATRTASARLEAPTAV